MQIVRRALLAAVGVVVWMGTGGSVGAQPAPEPRPPDTTGASSEADTVFVASGEVWAGTLAAQVRQRALFRLQRPPSSRSGSAGSSEAGGVSIGGLIINQTRTTIGRDFYDVFYGQWETPEGADNVMIRVYEQPRPNLGTRILVDVEDQTVFRATVRPRFQQIKQAAESALARTIRYVKRHYEPRERY